jgi:hypothetical protein
MSGSSATRPESGSNGVNRASASRRRNRETSPLKHNVLLDHDARRRERWRTETQICSAETTTTTGLERFGCSGRRTGYMAIGLWAATFPQHRPFRRQIEDSHVTIWTRLSPYSREPCTIKPENRLRDDAQNHRRGDSGIGGTDMPMPPPPIAGDHGVGLIWFFSVVGAVAVYVWWRVFK